MTSQATKNRAGPLGHQGIEESDDVGNEYRFDHLRLRTVMGDMSFGAGDPGPGDAVPGFDLPTLDGGRFRSLDLGETGPVLMIFGSYTCPVTDNAAPGLNKLFDQFGDRVRFVMVGVREAHPGKDVPQPRSLDEKMAHAVKLRDLHGFRFEVAVDDVDGTLHRALSPKPNSAYVLDKTGMIVFRAQWANDSEALAAALPAAAAEQFPGRPRSGGVIRPMFRTLRNIAPALDRAGAGAWRDMWLVAPPVAAIAFALKTLRIGPRS